jgi:hypothetical protein
MYRGITRETMIFWAKNLYHCLCLQMATIYIGTYYILAHDHLLASFVYCALYTCTEPVYYFICAIKICSLSAVAYRLFISQEYEQFSKHTHQPPYSLRKKTVDNFRYSINEPLQISFVCFTTLSLPRTLRISENGRMALE